MSANGSTYASADGLPVGGELVPPGHHRIVRVPVLTDLDSSEIGLYIHAVVGAAPGPVLALHTTLHGSEWQPIEVVRRLVEGLDPAAMRGALLAVPVGNPIALASRTRNLRDESDSPDLNRAFGGQQAWLADQLARALTEHLLRPANALVDFHCGLWGAAMGSVTCGRDYADASVSRRSFELACAFGHPYIRRSDFVTRFPGPRSSIGYAGQELGVPGFVVEIGGAGFEPALEERWTEDSVRGLRNVLAHLGILPDAPRPPERILVFTRVQRVDPTNGGMVEPLIQADELMTRVVESGELLGRVWSPYTLEVVEELRAPFRGLVDMAPRRYPARPGDWGYLLVDVDDSDTRWLGPEEAP